jgi:prepilin-type N-terminal cleavage/methylation domain-containing protein
MGFPAKGLQRRTAFTLAEMVVVVLILSIMAVVSVPRYMGSLANYQAEAAARRIKVDLELLRQQARRSSATRTVTFDLANHTYTLANVISVDRPGQTTYTVNLQRSPYSARLVSANCGGDTALAINGFGTPDSSATIVVQSGSVSRTITVEGTAGKVSIQ